MRFGLFYEHQLPRPWAEGDEERLLLDALEQVELADRLGFDVVWEVEHHFLEEYSHSSAPEVFLAACSQRTSSIRLGHGIVQLPPGYNHPARVAERAATLDLISGGRVELGTGESSAEAELRGFGVERATKREQWAESLDALTRMFVEEPFAGYEGRWLTMPPRNVVPKAKQRPHPPLWVACSRRETIRLAAEKGIGALSFAFITPDEARAWVQEYESIITSGACVPGGFAVNPRLAVVLPFMVHRDADVAVERGAEGAHFFGYALAHHYALGAHQPGVTDVWAAFQAQRHLPGLDMGILRGAIGTPDTLRGFLRGYAEAGVDQVVFIAQAGRTRHEHICEAYELFAAEVLPEFAASRDDVDRAKDERLAPHVAAALARRDPPRTAPADYVIEAAPRVGIDPL